jgi:Zn-finger nucleic acid-binding protein
MAAETLNCPMCGAPATSDATRCEHCGARLATVACPSCFGMMFVGQKFCPHCGAQAQRTEVSPTTKEMCPRCQSAMEEVVVGKENLHECPKCEGIWADVDSLDRICQDREEQSAVLGMAAALPAADGSEFEEKIRYLPCPICKKLMNRVNFANCSHVIVDVCKGHGTWFDKDELRRIVEFIRAGGMQESRTREIEELEAKRRAAAQGTQGIALMDAPLASKPSDYDTWGIGISAAAAFLKLFLK